MGYRINTPPNWPTQSAPDRRPPEGRKAVVSWGPALDGWNFWIGDPSFVGQPSPEVSASATPSLARKNWFLQHKVITGKLEDPATSAVDVSLSDPKDPRYQPNVKVEYLPQVSSGKRLFDCSIILPRKRRPSWPTGCPVIGSRLSPRPNKTPNHPKGQV